LKLVQPISLWSHTSTRFSHSSGLKIAVSV
jgi:hypothetical protein